MPFVRKTNAMRLYVHESLLDSGKREGSVELRKEIKQFIDAYDIDMDDFESPDYTQYFKL
ncbi:hypothetical protein VTG60DRAFT_6893 [Thermothelomyces hinnuleus]